MSELVIRAEQLGKVYWIGSRQTSYRTLRDAIAEAALAPIRRLSRTRDARATRESIWALRNVSFELRRGEVLGVIGRNGSGKSTLLKILSRITDPSRGRAEIAGRVGSLLEVGTGFHPELSGRDNVYLNGAILGMKRAEIARRFDEIVAFADVDRFIDTPVKRYSSGMHMRLAFSVAAHLEPDILIVDEVLAVGDLEFQKRCLGKMESVAREGRTVLFVSHNMGAIRRLCTRGLLLGDGQVVFTGSVEESIRTYIGLTAMKQERQWSDARTAPGNDVVRLMGVAARNRVSPGHQLSVRDPIDVDIDYAVLEPGHQICISLELLDAMGQALAATFDEYIQLPWNHQAPHEAGVFRSTCRIPGDLLNEGRVELSIRIFSPPYQPNDAPHVRELNTIGFFVHDKLDAGGARGSYPHGWGAPALRPWLRWSRRRLDD